LPLTVIQPTGVNNNSTFTFFAGLFSATIVSSNTLTGAVVIKGGIGVGQDIHFGGNLYQNGVLFTGGGGTATNATYSLWANTATNIEGGESTQIPVQINPGQTGFISTGNFNTVLVSEWPGGLPAFRNYLQLDADNNAFNTQSGALIVVGGVGIGQDLHVGGDIYANRLVIDLTTVSTTLIETDDIIKTLNTTNATSTSTGALQIAGGGAFGKDVWINGILEIQNGTNATSTATGSIQTNGGIGIGKDLWVNGIVEINNGTNATSTATGSLQTNGGIGIGKDLWVNGQVNITNATEATSTTTGALIVTGGVGIGRNIVSRGSLFIGSGTISVGTIGEIRASNEITAYYGSDINLKENIKLLENPLEKIEKIAGYEFDWKDSIIAERGGEDGYYVRKHDIGVIAQEIEQILPEIVGTRPDGFKAVKYEKIVPLLIEAIKQQNKILNQILLTLKNNNIK